MRNIVENSIESGLWMICVVEMTQVMEKVMQDVSLFSEKYGYLGAVYIGLRFYMTEQQNIE